MCFEGDDKKRNVPKGRPVSLIGCVLLCGKGTCDCREEQEERSDLHLSKVSGGREGDRLVINTSETVNVD